MWTLEYNLSKNRVKKDVFDGVTTFDVDVWFADDENGKNKPMTQEESKGLYRSSHGWKNIQSVKAFERHLRKYCNTPELRKVEFILVSRYYLTDDTGVNIGDYSVTARWID